MSEHVCEKKREREKNLSFQKAHALSCQKSLVLKQNIPYAHNQGLDNNFSWIRK